MLADLYQKLMADKLRALFVILAVSLPFDRIPSFAVADIHIRPSVIFGLAIIYLAARQFLRQPTKMIKSFNKLQWLLGFWLLWMIVNLSRVHDWQSAAKTIVPLGFLVTLALSISLLWKIKYLKATIDGVLLGASLTVAFGFYQFIGNFLGLSNILTGIRPEYSWQRFGFPRMHAASLEPLYFSCYLLLPIGLLTVLMVTRKEYRRWFYFLLISLMLVADFLTLSRGGLAALIFMMMIMAVMNIKFLVRRAKFKTVLAGMMALVIIFAASLAIINAVAKKGQDSDLTYNKTGAATYVSQLKNFHFSASAENKAKDDSVNQRNTARNQTIDVLRNYKEVLLFGVGPGQYREFIDRHLQGTVYATPNNIVLEQLEQTGVIGFGLLMVLAIILVVGLYNALKNFPSGLNKDFAGWLIAYLLAITLQAQTFSGLAITHLWFAVGLAIFLVQYSQDKHKDNKSGQVTESKRQ